MFTGIIKNLGHVKSISNKGNKARLVFSFQNREKHVEKGESIAVNGVCLTAVQINPAEFSADLVQETLNATSLGRLKPGNRVNLERSLRVGDAIGGHFVTGHVDAVGKVEQIIRRGGNWSLLVNAPKTIISKLAVKGSIACDGVSLTVQELNTQSFRVAVIPHTLNVTTLAIKKTGDEINLEIDMLMRYLERHLKKDKKKQLSAEILRKQGF